VSEEPPAGGGVAPPMSSYGPQGAPSDLSASFGVAPEPEPDSWHNAFRALRHRDFRLFTIGQSISLIGTWMQSVALSWLVYRLTNSEFLLGVTFFCAQLPVFLLAPLGGSFADRHSRHRLVLQAQVLSMIQALLLAALTLTGRVAIWHVLALALFLGCVTAFEMPALQALFIHMTGKEDLLGAISLNSAVYSSARIIGPAIAGLLVARFGEGLCFLLNGLSFLGAILALRAMRIPPSEPPRRESSWRHLLDGFTYTASHGPVRWLLLVLATTAISGNPVVVLLPFFVGEVFGRGSEALGFLVGAMGVGAVIGTLVLARRRHIGGLPRVVLLGAVAMGACVSVFPLFRSYFLALAIMPVIGFSVVRHLTAVNTLLQVLTPDTYRGRVMALYSMTLVGLAPFASLAAGLLAGRLGAGRTVFLGGVVCLAGAGLFRWRGAPLLAGR